MENSNLINVSFKKPEPQSKLNEKLGLTVQDVADSLGIEAKTVRRDLVERDVLERIKSCGFNAVPFGTPNPTNGVIYTDYVLDLNAAKFFIAKYNNKVADQYLAYLIKVESDAQAEGLTSHIDPTGLFQKISDPRFLSQMLATMADALDAEKARADEAIRTKAEISDKKTASAMGTASAAVKKLRLLETKLGVAEDNKTASGWIREYPALKSIGSETAIGKALSTVSKKNNLEVSKTPHVKFGSVNVYSREAALQLIAGN